MTRGTAPIVLGLAVAVRLVWWRLAHGPIEGGDSSRYLDFASRIAQGDFTSFREWPFHQLYSVTLAPMFLLPVSQSTYLLAVHVTVSSATVLLLYVAAAGLLGRNYGIAMGIAASLYVPFLFWMPYILTETTFLFAVGFYVWASVALLAGPRVRSFVIWLAAAAVFVLARPAGPPVAAASFIAVACALLARSYGVRAAVAAAVSIVLVTVVCATIALSSAAIRQRILQMPTVVQSVWASTKVSTGNMADARAFGALDEQVDQMFLGMPLERKIAYKVEDALTFIKAHPATYARMAARKLVAFWLPWAFTDDWSPAHRAVDAAISLGLTIGLLLALRTPMPRHMIFFSAALAAAFALLSAFSQIDPDGRYRVPAELPILLIAPAGWLWLLSRLTGWNILPKVRSH